MCVILHLVPDVMPTASQLECACYNNWHSYGLVTIIGNKLDIKKVVPESGEVDPVEVYDLLSKNIKHERFLHLRHNTAGATSLENCHPFTVFKSKKREVVFMHNGTFYPFISKRTTPSGAIVDDPDGPSDTKNFVDQIIAPYMAAMDFGNGHGDIGHPLFRSVITKNWSGSNRGVLIANDQPAVFFDTWKRIKGKGGDFGASNDDYFDKITRGPEKERREELAKAKVEAERSARTKPLQKEQDTLVQIQPLSNFRKEPGSRHPFYSLSESLVTVLNDWDVYDRSGAVALGFADKDELAELYENKDDCLTVMDWVFTDYTLMFEELLKLEEQKDAATKLIATLKNEVAALKADPNLRKVG